MTLGPPHSFLYHSFPRRFKNEPDDARARRAMTILDSIARNGLLMTIEDVSWQEQRGDVMIAPVGAVQRRICFTNLRPDELTGHAEFFGPISIEYTAEAFIHVGGVPVIYFPRMSGTKAGLEGIGAAMVARIADVHDLARTLAQLEDRLAGGGDLTMSGTRPDGTAIGQTYFTAAEAAAIQRFLACVHSYASIPPFADLRGAISAVGELFYPTDDAKYTGALGYYQQREWRILSVRKDGKQIAIPASDSQRQELIALNERFFRRKFRFMDGEDEMVGRCHFYRELNGKHVVNYARRVIVPSNLVDEVRSLLGRHGIGIEVTDRS